MVASQNIPSYSCLIIIGASHALFSDRVIDGMDSGTSNQCRDDLIIWPPPNNVTEVNTLGPSDNETQTSPSTQLSSPSTQFTIYPVTIFSSQSNVR